MAWEQHPGDVSFRPSRPVQRKAFGAQAFRTRGFQGLGIPRLALERLDPFVQTKLCEARRSCTLRPIVACPPMAHDLWQNTSRKFADMPASSVASWRRSIRGSGILQLNMASLHAVIQSGSTDLYRKTIAQFHLQTMICIYIYIYIYISSIHNWFI